MPPRIRAALFSYFELPDVARLMDAISSSGMPAGTRIHVGSYGVIAEASAVVKAAVGGRYSPMFKSLERTAGWERRHLTPDEERREVREGPDGRLLHRHEDGDRDAEEGEVEVLLQAARVGHVRRLHREVEGREAR